MSGGTKRATSANVPLLGLQSSEGRFPTPREIEPGRRSFCRRGSCTFTEVARLVPSGDGQLPHGPVFAQGRECVEDGRSCLRSGGPKALLHSFRGIRPMRCEFEIVKCGLRYSYPCPCPNKFYKLHDVPMCSQKMLC